MWRLRCRSGALSGKLGSVVLVVLVECHQRQRPAARPLPAPQQRRRTTSGAAFFSAAAGCRVAAASARTRGARWPGTSGASAAGVTGASWVTFFLASRHACSAPWAAASRLAQLAAAGRAFGSGTTGARDATGSSQSVALHHGMFNRLQKLLARG